MDQPKTADLPAFDADMIIRTLPNAQYNPYRIWFFGDSDNRTSVKVMQIKAAEDFSLCAAPSLGIMVTGKDYLQTQANLRTALLNHLNKPENTPVAVTCTAAFNLSGDTLITPPKSENEAFKPETVPTTSVKHTDDPLAAIAVPGATAGEPLESDLAEQFGLNI